MFRARRQGGFSLIEIAVVVALIGVLAAVTAPRLDDFFANMRARSAARAVADTFELARAEAIRTGNVHAVFLSASQPPNPPATDPGGNPIGAPMLVINDGPPGAINCVIDGGDPQRAVAAQAGVSWGYSLAGGTAAPGDTGGGPIASGSSFTDPGGTPVTWVLFRPDGIPVAFDNACNLGSVGSGGGAVYITNGQRDYAIVLTPLGGVRVHSWNAEASAWNG
jgi:prepilin-type N-terminal cleavage/methylation domain-containing protein